MNLCKCGHSKEDHYKGETSCGEPSNFTIGPCRCVRFAELYPESNYGVVVYNKHGAFPSGVYEMLSAYITWDEAELAAMAWLSWYPEDIVMIVATEDFDV